MTKAAFKMTSTTPIITIATTVPITAPRENTFFLSADRKNVFSLRRRAAAAAAAGAVMGTVMGTRPGTVMGK